MYTSFWNNCCHLGIDSEHIHSYSLSGIGKPCLSPIENESRCIKASKVLIKAQQDVIGLPKSLKMLPFVRPSGNGYDVPKGCIVQMDDRLSSMDFDTGRIEVDPHCNDKTCLGKMTCTCLKPGTLPRFVYWNPNGVAIISLTCNLIMIILLYLKKDWVALIWIRMDLLVGSVDPMRVRSNPIQNHGS